MHTIIRAAVVLLVAGLPLSLTAAPIPSGDGYQIIKIGGSNFEIFTYKPASYNGGPLLMVFHGVERDADTYRDNAKTIADRFGMAVAAPLFDKSRFPSALYQRGGIANQKALQPQDKWVGTLAIGLTDQLRRDEGRPDMDYYMIGHSAGGQFWRGWRPSSRMPPNASSSPIRPPGSSPPRRRLFPLASAAPRPRW